MRHRKLGRVSSGVLDGWAQIASYLNLSERTAQRWHARYPMPVVRWGYYLKVSRAALDQWLTALPMVGGPRYTVPQPPCPHCGLRPTDHPPRATPTPLPLEAGREQGPG